MRRALVTGATGFLGSHLVRGLLQRGVAVHALGRREARDWLRDLAGSIELHRVGLGDRADLARCVASIAPDTVFHLAAATMRGGVAPDPVEVFRTNALGTVNLIDACVAAGVARVVNTGDALEYGPAAKLMRASDRCAPTTADGIARLAATQYARAVGHALGRAIVTLRLFSVYGPGDHPERLIPRLAVGALRGEPVALSHAEIARDFLYVDDAVELFLCAAERAASVGGEILNAASGRRTSIGELVALVERLTGARVDARWGAFREAAHDRASWRADLSRTMALLPWRPAIALEEGLARTLQAVRGCG